MSKGMNNISSGLWRIDAVGAVCGLLLLVVLYLIGVGPLVSEHGLMLKKQVQLDLSEKKLGELNSKLNMLKNRIILTGQALEASPVSLGSSDQVNRHVSDLTKLATSKGLGVHKVVPLEPIAGRRYQIVPLVLGGTGSYTSCKSFLHELTDKFPDTGVSSFELINQTSEKTGEAKFEFQLVWYTAPEHVVQAK